MTAKLYWSNTVPPKAHTPGVLFSCARLDDLARWRAANPWSKTLPMIVFGDHELDPLGKSFQDDELDSVPSRVENAPAIEWREVLRPPVEGFTKRLREYHRVAKYIAARAPIGPAWIVYAGADGGVLASAVASARGRAFALSTSAIDTIGMRFCLDDGVELLHTSAGL